MADEVASLKVLITGDASDLQSAIQQTENALGGLNVTARRSSSGAVNGFVKAGSTMKDFGENVDAVTKPLQVTAVGLAAGGVAAAKFAIDFEDSFAAVKKTVDSTPAQIEKIKQGIIDLSTVGIDGRSALPMTTTKLNELASTAGQLGVEAENILTFTETVAQMETATNLAGAEGASTMARYLNVMGLGNDAVGNLGSALVDLGNNTATTEAEIAEMALRLGKFGATVGMGAADVLGYSAALSSMGIEAQAGGSAVGRTWLAIEEAVATGGDELNAFAKYSGKSADKFAKQWSTDTKGAFNSLLKGMKEGTEQGEELVIMLSELGIENTLDQQAIMALVNGFDSTAESVERANRAWSENSALQTEFNAKADTTASKIEIAKNNLIEAGRSIGEAFLPMVADAATDLAEFAQKIASMDDEAKQTTLTVGKWVIGLGAASKGVSGITKTVGGVVKAFGKLKTAASAGGTLAKFAPALTEVKAAAGPAALGILALDAAVVAGQIAYDKWYYSQFQWSKGLADGNEAVRESLDNVKEIDEIQDEIEALNLIIENPESSKQEIDDAKNKLNEIADLLREEYDLVIKSDNSNLEEAVSALKEKSNIELSDAIREQEDRLGELLPEFNKDTSNMQAQYNALADKYDKLNEFDQRIHNAFTAFNDHETMSLEDYEAEMADIAEEVNKYLNKGTGEKFTGADVGAGLTDELETTKDKADKLNKSLKLTADSKNEYIAISKELANWQTELIQMKAEDGDTEGVNSALASMSEYIKNANLDLQGYAQAAALAMNGVNSLKDAWKQADEGKPEALNDIVKDYIKASSEFGATAENTAVNAALLASGFRTMEEAAQEEDGIEKVTGKINELAGSVEGIPTDGLAISIDEKGITTFTDANEKVKAIVSADGTTVRVDAEGNVETLDEAGEQISYLQDVGAVELEVNAEGDILAKDGDGNIVSQLGLDESGNIDLEINAKTDNATLEIKKLNEEQVDLEVGANTEPAKEEIDALNGRKINVTVNANYAGGRGLFGSLKPKETARGTSDFEGGLAMINDERGVSDPRELVEVGGKGYIFEGKDVVLPLPKHAKVYTADQTKAIMAGKGIPHYASGKNNEAWDAAQSDWQHYTKINDVSAAEALAHWKEMLEKFKNDAEVVKEIQEEIVASTKDLWKEELDAMKFAFDMGWTTEEEYYEQLWRYRDENFEKWSDEYKDATLELHKYAEKQREESLKAAKDALETSNKLSAQWVDSTNILRNWEEQGENIIDAYIRVRDRNLQAVKDGVQTEKEAQEEISGFTEQMLTGKVSETVKWLDREEQLWGMSTAEQKEELAKQRAEIDAFYASAGNLTDEEKVIMLKVYAELDDADFAVIDKEISEWEQDAALYLQESQTLGWDWKNKGDSAATYYQRMVNEYQDFLDNGGLNAAQYKDVLTKRREAELDAYSAAEQEFEDMLSEKMDEINEMQERFSDEINALQESWNTEDRQADIEETKKQLGIFENAVTKEGREEYERLQEELKQLERDEQLYQMEQENNAVLERMEAEYKRLEEQKGTAVNDILDNAKVLADYMSGTKRSSTEELLGNIQKEELSDIAVNLKNLGTTLIEIFKNLDFDININNNISTTGGVDENALVRPLQRVVSLIFGGK